MLPDNRIFGQEQSALAQLIAVRTILHVTYRADRENEIFVWILLHKGIEKNLAHLHRKALPGKLLGITLQAVRHNLPGSIDAESPGGAQCDDDGGRLIEKLSSL